MSIGAQNAAGLRPAVISPDSMYELVCSSGLIPFFENPVPGWSVEEHTPAHCWFTEENLGPWDWKIEVVRSGDIAYGKFFAGRKAAFATVDCYRDLARWRRSLPAARPDEAGRKILEAVRE